jgi:hypothetical protein
MGALLRDQPSLQDVLPPEQHQPLQDHPEIP